MSIKLLRLTAVAALLFGVAGFAIAGSPTDQASSHSPNPSTYHTLPVLLQVNDQGKITDMSPAFELRPRFRAILRQTLDAMITAPAHRDGHAVPSKFIINMATQSTPRADGKYNVRFVYVSTSPVPSGQWHWKHINGHRLALVNRDFQPIRSYRRPLFRHRTYQRQYTGHNQSNQHTTAPAHTAQHRATPRQH